ncbi:hypothetical protein GCM10022627_35220 [Haloarcula argentinensis]|uniref:Uncharacterized protein n=1 Tax=Haloarcula argentinensis TaxID=43776 RepID=A0A830FRB6_HALAR|nr:hypothetical protein GCM10009006_33630 [Haloarcula argentinensis]
MNTIFPASEEYLGTKATDDAELDTDALEWMFSLATNYARIKIILSRTVE